MTPQTPPTAVTPFPAYPTAPPWARSQPSSDPPPDTGPPTAYGQLIVTHPELLHGAGRPKPPSWAPVVRVTLLIGTIGSIAVAAAGTMLFGTRMGMLWGWATTYGLGLLGMVPAIRRQRTARLQGNPRYPYWLSFCLSYGAAAFLSVVTVSVAATISADYRESVVTTAVESSIVHDGKVKTAAGVTVRETRCTPTASRGADGTRPYLCQVTLSTGATGPLRVVADQNGTWTAVKGG